MAGHSLEALNIPFRDSFRRKIGDGSKTRFWEDVWIGGHRLKDSFPRLYRLETEKDVHIADRVSFDRTAAAQVPDVTQAAAGTDTDIIFSWAWAREPMYRTQDELMLLESLIKSFQFNQNSDDTFEWSMASDGNFSVKKLTNFINEKLFHSVQSNHETLKNNLVPKKLEVFVWRTIKKRLPVRMELDKRGIDLNSLRCPICDDDLESVDHSLIFCKYSLELWNRVCKWWGFNQFGNLSMNEILRGITPKNTSMLGKKIWQAVEWVTTYYIWKNFFFFNG
ncbi:uncharacterized protein [Rutidosis leptorrhynchoides]|uniref:uncharacterized protein n=1 Tax=Rutidosis leptorrhynchoides TaxID=125765 RepID=UPI003A990924